MAYTDQSIIIIIRSLPKQISQPADGFSVSLASNQAENHISAIIKPCGCFTGFHTTNELHQSLLDNGPRPTFSRGWVCSITSPN